MECKGGNGFTAVDDLFELAGAASTADKADALVGSWVADTEHGFEQVLLQYRYVEPLDRIRRLKIFDVKFQTMPATAKIHFYHAVIFG